MTNSHLSSSSCETEIVIAATSERVWRALAEESAQWWPRDFVTSERTTRFVIEARLGGRAYEDFGEGDGLVWYQVIGVEAGRELILAGHLLPPFGGPAITALRLTLSTQGASTVLKIRDDRFGILGGDSPVAGWRTVFDEGLRRYLETSDSHPRLVE